ncbi:MAG: LacI family DNA-binding transcriptional regulator [Verrucomicrobia bacterium]|nr:LacI family DNA-binding transcriptional regulator [Verrucomicrobiota bacterium]
MQNIPQRIRLKDIAEKAGLSVAAVSMALKNHRSLPATTIKRVQNLAESMGYAPDPALSALAAHRSRLRVHKDFSVIGLVSNWSREDAWTNLPSGKAVVEGAKARALELGFTIQHMWCNSKNLSANRFDQILKARGIRGLILAPLHNYDDRIELDWNQYSVVTLEKPLHYSHFHHVVQNHYSDLILCWKKLKERNYKRIGLIVRDHLSSRWGYQWESAHHLVQSSTTTQEKTIPTLQLKDENQEDHVDLVRSWLKLFKPDAVISRCDCFFEAAEGLGLKIPNNIGYVSLNVTDDVEGATGIHQHRDIMGATAIDVLNSLLQRNFRGEHQVSVGTQVDGSWIDGKTLLNRVG